ncbi:unnamed protein product [Pichia kudriavzevii]
MSDDEWGSLNNSNAARSVASLKSNEHHDTSNNEDALDAMGMIHDDSIRQRHHNDTTFNDHRRVSNIQPDQRMIRPPRNYGNGKYSDPFTQQSKLLSHEKDRQGQTSSDMEYGSVFVSKNHLPKSTTLGSGSVPFPGAKFQPQMPKPLSPFNQSSKLSQSVPISLESQLNDRNSPPSRDDDSIYAPSNPTTRRNSDSSSLNDVCFPVDNLEETERSKKWPNLKIMQEFADEEINELKLKHQQSLSSSADENEENNNVNFQYPIISNVDYGDITTPLITSTNEEIDPINGRLRPQTFNPWGKPEYVSRHDKLTKLRFTYFREDIPNTIHSPTISGLLHGGKRFEDLFSPDHYSAQYMDTIDEKEPLNLIHKTTTIPSVSSNTVNSTVHEDNDNHHARSAQPFWLDVLNPTDEEMKAISKCFGIHPLTSEDIFLGEAREKVEVFNDYYFICFTSFDVEEEHQKRKRASEKAYQDAMEEEITKNRDKSFVRRLMKSLRRRRSANSSSRESIRSINSSRGSKNSDMIKSSTSVLSKRKKTKHSKDELVPLNMYIVVFKEGVITFHFKPTPHTGNVRRRARLLRDYLTVTSDWVGYALIDDITDAFAPLIDAIQNEVNEIEDEIIRMQSGDSSDSEPESDSETEDEENPVWFKMKRRNSNISGDKDSIYTRSTSSSNSTANTRIVSWKKKGDMLRRIGDCRRRVMSLVRLLGSKADVIKGFSKRYNEQWGGAPRSEIGLYLGDIQDHIVTMFQNLNHYEKLLARSHSNYLAQINIDMTKVNNDMNDILGKITIMGTIVLPLNIVTGLWGMNCLVPGQDVDNLNWFWMIVTGMAVFSITCYYYVKKIMNIV